LLIAAASHGLVDLLTHGDVGVAWLSPFTRTRWLSPWRPLPVCPLGLDEYFGRLGAMVLLDELLLLLVPVAIAAELVRTLRTDRRAVRGLAAASAGWLTVLLGVCIGAPSVFGPTRERVLRSYGQPASDDDLGWVPRGALPEGMLITRFDTLEHLFGRELTPSQAPWSSSFFPAWFGGEAGRWRDNRAKLIVRTLARTSPPAEAEATERLATGELAELAPTEKYDLALDDLRFTATRKSLELTHNRSPVPRFWFGLCNGVAAASIERLEPFRDVEVVSPLGHAVRFHPIDIKALLAKAYYQCAETSVLGGACTLKDFDPGATCSMNPGGLAIATLNYLGRARRSFLVEVHPTVQSQYYAVASARLDVTRAPYSRTTEPTEPGFAARIASLVDVDFAFTLSSTMLPIESGDVPEAGDGRYHRVGVHPVLFRWSATLALDAERQIIGGRWRGDPPDGPDNVAFCEGGPLLDGGGTHLSSNPNLDWAIIDALATASAQEQQSVPRLQLPLDGGR
jgi:hypothetical protein